MFGKSCFRVVVAGMVLCAGGLGFRSVGAAEGVWLQWRGPERTSQLTGVEWPDGIGEQQLVAGWEIPLEPSYSTPIVTEDRVFVTETVDKKEERVRALDRETGEELWQVSWPGAITVPFFAMANGSWIRATPIYDSGKLYVPGMKDYLICLDANTGDKMWDIDFVAHYDVSVPAFGCVCSPLIEGDYLYIQAGSGFIKLNKLTGEPVWRVLTDKGGMEGAAFSSPVIAEIEGVQQLVVQTRTSLAGVSPESGDIYWTQEVPAFRGMNILTPLVVGDQVFTSTYGGKTWLYEVTKNGDAFQTNVVWEENQQGYMSSPVLIDDHIYLHMKNERFCCIDVKTGERKWTTGAMGKYWSMVATGGKILALNDRGNLYLIRANPEKFDVLDERTVSDDSTWAHLVVTGDDVFVRALSGLKKFSWKR